jgi:hypothetical protein
VQPDPATKRRPTLDQVLIRQLANAARDNDDDLTWLLLGNLAADADRCTRWSLALAGTRSNSGQATGTFCGAGSPGGHLVRRLRQPGLAGCSSNRHPGFARHRLWRTPPTPPGTGCSTRQDSRDRTPFVTWQVVMPAEDLWEGELTGVQLGDKKIVLLNVAGEIRAFEDRCPHLGFQLSEGSSTGAR